MIQNGGVLFVSPLCATMGTQNAALQGDSMLYIIAILIIVLDQTSKYLIKTYMQIGESFPLLGDVLRLTSHRNPGAAFGILQGQRWFFILIGLSVIIGIFFINRKIAGRRRWLRVALGLLMGGAVGNLIDRILYGYVVDFIDVRIIHYPIFNVADSAIVLAVILLLVESWKAWRNESPREER